MPKVAFLEFRSIEAKTVSVAGDFNDWAGSAKGNFDPSKCQMTQKGPGLWVYPLNNIPPGRHEFKYIIDGKWEPGPNRVFYLDEDGNLYDHTGGVKIVTLEDKFTIKIEFCKTAVIPRILDKQNFKIKPSGTIISLSRFEPTKESGEVIVLNCSELDITENIYLQIHGISDKPIIKSAHYDGIFQKMFISNKKLGVSIENDPPKTIFRVFAPRAKEVILHLFEDANMEKTLNKYKAIKDENGVWEVVIDGHHWNKFYSYTVNGPQGEGEGFKPEKLWPDPWCIANVFHFGPSIIVNTNEFGNGFEGWSDSHFKTPDKKDLIIYEASIRDLTSHESSKVAKNKRGKYLGLASTLNSDTGLDHVRKLGVNAIEFLPVFEFDDNPPGSYHWGYMPSFFFAPEASYAENIFGGQVNEFKALVNACHQAGLAVILDVVYNHTGSPDVLMGFDKKYFYRHDGNYVLQNFSGCGNDLKTENPMTKKIILDSLEFWMQEYHIDGFRFDLAELLNVDTLLLIEERLKKIKPDVILIAEPWSFRGNIKGKLRGTSWSCWNDDFRNGVKEFVLGHIPASSVAPLLKGSVDYWTSHPLESINYVESHDDYTLTDYLTRRPDHNGSYPSDLDIKRNLLCAAAIFLSPGIPMIAQGQEMLRSKKGNPNSYNAGDEINTVNYNLKDKYKNVYNCYKNLISFRNSDYANIIKNATLKTCKEADVFYGSNSHSLAILWKDTQTHEMNLKSYVEGTLTKEIHQKMYDVLVIINADTNHNAKFTIKLPHGKWYKVLDMNNLYCNIDYTCKLLFVSKSDESVNLSIKPLSFEVWIHK